MKLAVLVFGVAAMIAGVVTQYGGGGFKKGKQQVGGRHRLRLSDIFDYARPYFKGHLRLGPLLDFNWDFMGQENAVNWWEGPNVCHTRQEEEEAEPSDIQHHHVIGFMSCDQTETHYKCSQSMVINGKKKTVTHTFECCHGYERKLGTSGCRKEMSLEGLVETLKKLKLNDVVRGIKSVALTTLLDQGNFTIFAPIDGSFEIPDAQTLEDEAIRNNGIILYPETSDVVDQVRDILASHVVDGFLKSGSLQDEQVIESISPRGSTIRINKYETPKQLVTANCVPIQSTDHLATNGVVHVVSKLLPPARQTLFELIVSDPNLTTLKAVLAKAEFGRTLEREGTFTIFAPTNAAFDKIHTRRLARLLDSGECLKNVLKTHVLPHVICSSVIEGQARTRNMLDVFLHVMRNDTDKLFVEQAQIVTRDIMASNGVMHVIDDVILPDQALDIVEILDKKGYNEFLELLESAELKKTIGSTDNITILVPSQQAIESIPGDVYRDLTQDPGKLKEVLSYHVITDGQLDICDIRDGMQLHSFNSSKTIAVRQYSSFPFSRKNALTAQCARVTQTVNIESCNAVAHVIDKVLMPPVGDVLDVLSQNSNFSLLVELLKESGIAEELQLSGPFTVFAPTNEYMAALNLDALRNDPDRLKSTLRNHVLSGTLCCAGVFTSYFGKSGMERMLGGQDVSINRRGDDVYVDGNVIESCDLTATNGVVHALAGILDEVDSDSHEFDLDLRSSWMIIDDHLKHFNQRRRQQQNRRRPEKRENEWPWWMRRLASSRRG